MTPAELAEHFEEWFGTKPRIFRAPGRVNLIGEHTDYNDGFVMPSAIGLATRVAISPAGERKLVIRSENFDEQFEFSTEDLPKRRLGLWCDYVVGVAVMLQQNGYPIQGANLMVRGDVPIGAGLSSSAALEVASALALTSLNGDHFSMPEVAKLCHRAENLFIGARVGVMDQFISCLGQAGHALLLDCRSLEYKSIPISDSVRLVICNTMVKHDHANGEYNLRREQCEEGLKLLSRWDRQARALRDISIEQLERHAKQMPETIYKRCLHVVRENQRVLQGAQCLEQGDLSSFGRLMQASHHSLRHLYEVSCRELDIMVELAEGLTGYCGGRMTGGGFGGCTVNLVENLHAATFAEKIRELYKQHTRIEPDVYICSAANGANAELMQEA